MNSLRCRCDCRSVQQANSDGGFDTTRPNRNGEAARINALGRAWEDAIINNDVAGLDRPACDDLAYSHTGCLVEGKEGFIVHIVNGESPFIPRTER